MLQRIQTEPIKEVSRRNSKEVLGQHHQHQQEVIHITYYKMPAQHIININNNIF